MDIIQLYQNSESKFRTGTTLLMPFVMITVILSEWSGFRTPYIISAILILAYLSMSLNNLTLSRKMFLVVGVLLTFISIFLLPNWFSVSIEALTKSTFVATFFLSLCALRKAAASSPAMEKCGRYLAEQKASIRYGTLTFGGHMFGVILSFGAISLLGSLAEKGANAITNEESRDLNRKAMLLAVQRGFVAMTCWSPLTFSIAITTSVIPNTSWKGAAISCITSALILIMLGWVLDYISSKKLKDKMAMPEFTSKGTWHALIPLAFIFITLLGIIFLLMGYTNLKAVPVVMLVVPIYSILWIAYQNTGNTKMMIYNTMHRVDEFVNEDIYNYKQELIVLIMAAFIGIMGSSIINNVAGESMSFLNSIPAPIILVSIIWIMPICGQIGMNPILAVYMIGPLIPSADVMGISPNSIIVALTAGWAICGISSPFTASTLLIAKLGRVTPHYAGLNWNGLFTIIGGLLLSVWIIIANEFIVT